MSFGNSHPSLEFDPRLESVRGIAALSVAWTHSYMVFKLSAPSSVLIGEVEAWLLLGLPAGAAVVLFFALSGHVLGLALMRDSDYVKFATRRLFRIFPALWVGVVLTFAVQRWISPGMPADRYHEWFQNVFLLPSVWPDLLRNLFLREATIDPVIWSLAPEVVCSLALPIAVYVHFKTGRVGRLTILALLLLVGHYADRAFLQYAATFYAGFFVPREIVAPLLTRNRFLPTAGALAGYLMICFGNRYGVAYTPTMRAACSLGSVILIGSLIAAPGSMKWLTVRPVRFLGRISFSFYLLHLPALYLLTATVSRIPALTPVSLGQTMAFQCASILLAVAAAAACYASVEVPTIAAGRVVAAKVADRIRPAFRRDAGRARQTEVA